MSDGKKQPEINELQAMLNAVAGNCIIRRWSPDRGFKLNCPRRSARTDDAYGRPDTLQCAWPIARKREKSHRRQARRATKHS